MRGYDHLDNKLYLYKTLIRPILMYGLEALDLKQHQIAQVQTCEANMVKGIVGVSTRSKTTSLMYACGLETAYERIELAKNGFYDRAALNKATRLAIGINVRERNEIRAVEIKEHLNKYGDNQSEIDDYTISKDLAKARRRLKETIDKNRSNGVVDSLKFLLWHKWLPVERYREKRELLKLLTRSF